ncbi:hypothetical protein AX14_004366 [Amanita brunnescens Koide BX004]|nr:hypothetical protein AX14_004366 [Amanita brunnescens Koide BX004]
MEMASAGSLTATLGIATVGDGSFFSLLEGRGEIAYVEIAGGGFSNAEIAEDEGCFIIAGNQKLL